MKKLSLIAIGILLTPLAAKAGTTCMGQTHRGTTVTVNVNTVGSMAFVNGGNVLIEKSNGDVLGYTLERNEIAQFFETADYNFKTPTLKTAEVRPSCLRRF